MNNFELEYGPIAAHMALLVFALLATRYPAALGFSFMTNKAFAWAPIFGVINYAKALFVLQFLAALVLIVLAVQRGAISRINAFVRRPESWVLWVLLAVWLKVSTDVLLGGLNMDRTEPLKTAPVQVFFPALIIGLSFLSFPVERVVRGVLLGMVAFPLVCIIPAMPGVIEGKRIALALQGTERFAIWGLDTIQGGQFFCYAALGGLGLGLMASGRYIWLKPASWGLFAACFFFLIINATRQFLLASVLGLVLSVVLSFKRNVFVAIGFVFFACAAGYFILGETGDAAAGKRISADALSGEVEASRGVIWTDAFFAGLKSPVRGVGFRNFGQVVTVVSDLTGETIVKRDTAHGFYQEIWAEHGMLLGLAAILASIWSLWKLTRAAASCQSPVLNVLAFLNISLIVTCLFSGTIYYSLAPYVLGVSMFALYLTGVHAYRKPGPRPQFSKGAAVRV
jgi:hypothetical protein